jgi:hypothetical protein
VTIISTLAAGKFTVTRDGVTAFDTSALKKSFNLVPDAAITLTGHTVTFPDLLTTNWYSAYQTPQGSFYLDGCDSYIAIIGQEWGPDKANVISDELLGTLPVKADYIDIQVKMTRTQAPTPYGYGVSNSSQTLGASPGTAWPQYLPDGEWVNLDGYSSVVEGLQNLVQRSMEFVFDPATGNISLRKRQSVNAASASFLSTTNPNSVGFYWDGGSGHNAGIVSCYLHWLQSIDAVPNGAAYAFNGSSHCNKTDITDYTSIYSMDAVITPGRISAAS